MKKIVFLILFIPELLFSNELTQKKTEHFIFKIENGVTITPQVIEISQNINNELNSLLKLDKTKENREIIILKSLDSYKEYISNLGIDTREDYIFIKYSDNRSRVVMYQADEIFEISLKHHLILQYMEHFASGSPYWFTLGLATYFEDRGSNRWINTLRRSINRDKIFTTLIKSEKSDIKPYFAWILIDYLINSDVKNHNRLLWDTLSYLKHSGDQNKTLTIENNFKRYNLDSIIFDYLESIKGYEDYMNTAIEYYQNADYMAAIENFKLAIKIEPRYYSPEYYLGLSYSGLDKYTEAYSHFSISLDKGAPKDIVYYSIGINFFLGKEFNNTKKYLSKLEDKMYKNMAKDVLNEIEKY